MIPKFRAYLNIHKKIVDVQEINYKYKEIVWVNGKYTEVDNFEDIELLQSTGLFDKHGKEIFEYEIVDVRTLEGTIYLRGVVKKVKGGFYIEELYNSKIIPLTDFYFKSYTNTLEIEILGNIYEHRGLLDNDS